MSTESSSTSTNYKNHHYFDLPSTKTLQSALSHNAPFSLGKHSLKPSTEEHHLRQSFNFRDRIKSNVDELSLSPSPDVTQTSNNLIKVESKREKRYSEAKLTIAKPDSQPIEGRHSLAQMPFTGVWAHPFRTKHQKSLNKEEPNMTTIAMATGNSNMQALGSPQNRTHSVIVRQATESSPKPSTIMEIPRIQLNSSEIVSTSHHVDTLSSTSFVLLNNLSEPRSAESIVFESHSSLYVAKTYREEFFDRFHINYYGELDCEGPFVASLRCSPCKTHASDTCEAHAIIRTQSRNYNVVESMNKTNENNILQILFSKVHLPAVQSFGTVGDPKANEKIYLFDKTNDERYNCKIGFIYQRLNQTNEQDIFNNETDLKEMFQFLEFISERVRLKNFQKYRGDLDVNEDLHGEYSYYAEHENHEIMFNVASLIPATNTDEQYTIRKGLVGNAFVCIVFQEPGATFSPDYISGKVTQIYITVQPMEKDDKLYYKIDIWRRNEISDTIEPSCGIVAADNRFSSYFRTLLLNSIDVAIKSPRLRNHIHEQRQRLKYEELKKLCQTFSVGPSVDFPNEIDSFHSQIEYATSIRTDSFHSTVTNSTSDTSSTTNAPHTPPPPPKKKGLQKFLGVFSTRSASMSSSSATTNHHSPEASQPNTSSALLTESYLTYGRANSTTNPEPAVRQGPSKSSQGPAPAIRSIHPMNLANHNSSNKAAAQLSRLTPNNMTDTNEIDPVVFNEPLRGRSNSSPHKVANTNKSQSFSTLKISHEESIDSETEGSEEPESEEEL